MHLEHSFSVTARVEETWRAMLDPERMVKCIPGAALDSVKNGVASGAIRVRFGAIGPTYRGTAQVVDKDDEGHRAIVEAQGGTRAHGDATVRMIVTLSSFGDRTNVMLQSDVRLTGRASELDAQVVSDVGDRLCRQVAARLNDLLTTPARREQPHQTPVPVATLAAMPDPAAEPPQVAPDPVPEQIPAAPAPAPARAHPAPPAPSHQHAMTRIAPLLLAVAILLLLRRRRRRGRRSLR